MSTTEIRSSETDEYQILNSYDPGINLELAVAQSLVQSAFDYTAVQANDGPNVFISPADTNYSWNINQLNPDYVNTSAISNYPSGTVTEHSVLSTYLSNNDVPVNSYNSYISSNTDECGNNNFTLEYLDTSAPYYDANYVIQQSLVANCYDNHNWVSTSFDTDNTNAKIQYAMQSRWNTVQGPYNNGLADVGPDPVALREANSLNTDLAFGKSVQTMGDSRWAAVNTDDGSLDFVSIATENQPASNNLLIADRDMTEVWLGTSDVGVYRIQKGVNTVNTTVALTVNNNTSTDTITNYDLANMPLFDGNGAIPLQPNSAKGDLPIPGIMNESEFSSLFNNDVLNTVANNWTFTVTVSSDGGGYTVDYNDLINDQLDSSNLYDNPYYMANYVSNPHHIDYSDASVNVVASTNGDTGVADSIAVDLTSGEKLDNTYAGVDGQIIMNTNTVTSRVADVGTYHDSGSMQPYVYYANDNVENNLSNEEMVNPGFNVMWQKVAQQTNSAPAESFLNRNNDALLTLYDPINGVVNSSYNAVDFSFNYVNPEAAADVKLWKVNILNNVVLNPQSFFLDDAYTTVEEGIATSGIIFGIQDGMITDKYRVLLTAKAKEDISLYTAVNETNGWTLDYTGDDPHLFSSSTQAYGENTLPVYNTDVMEAINSGASLNFSYAYKTYLSSKHSGGLADYVEISYQYDGSANPLNTVVVPQSSITRVYNDGASNVSYEVVSDSSYNFTNNIYSLNNWELVLVTANSAYNASFSASFGPFTNLTLTVVDIQQQDQFYAIRNKSNGQFAVQSALAAYISVLDTDALPNILSINETISPAAGSTLTLNGIFTANDMKAFFSVAQGANSSNVWSDIGDVIQTDVYYGFNNVDNLTNSGNLITQIEYSPFGNSINSSINVFLTELNYYIPFVYDERANSFTLSSFTSAAGDLGNNTNIGSSVFDDNYDVLDIANGYSCVNSWATNAYNLTVDRSIDHQIKLTIKNTGNQTVATLSILNDVVFLGDIYISMIPQDCMRVERLLTAANNDTTYAEVFQVENYGSEGIVLAPLVSGVEIYDGGNGNMYSDASLRPRLSQVQRFRVIGDYATVNLVGSVSVPNSSNELGYDGYNSNSLAFQYVDGNLYSAILTFPKYRGYFSYGDTATDQYYTVQRDSTGVLFIVDAVGEQYVISQTLTSNMYVGQTFVVDDLRDPENVQIANLNISDSFTYSIPPTGTALSYTVYVSGDAVSITLSNPNYIGGATNIPVDSNATPLPNPVSMSYSTNLATYGRDAVYTFSGAWVGTDALMAIRPSRVALYNNAYSYNSMTYQIQNMNGEISVYKAVDGSDVSFNWLGNPALHGSQDPDVVPSTNDWISIQTLAIAELNAGINIGRITVYQNPAAAFNLGIVYIVSVPTYYQFEQISVESCPVIPYDYNSQYLSNQYVNYMPFINLSNGQLESTFYPFNSSNYYTDINGNSSAVSTNQNILNNIRFDIDGTRDMAYAAYAEPDNTRYAILFPGTNMRISLYTGLYDSTDWGEHNNPIWDAPITSLPSTADVGANNVIFIARDNDGSIRFSALQFPVDIGYQSGVNGYQQILHTTDQSQMYNINFYVGNPSFFNYNDPITYFDANATGIKPVLYTVVNVNNPATQRNLRRVYKYESDGVVDIDMATNYLNGIQALTLTFNSRSYCDFDISMNSAFSGNALAAWNYNRMLNETVIASDSVNWSNDTNFSGNAYVSWAFGNSQTAENMVTEMLGVQNSEQKWTYIHLLPFSTFMNQFGMQVGGVAWDGSITAPLITTRVVQLEPGLNDPVLGNDTRAMQQYSDSMQDPALL